MHTLSLIVFVLATLYVACAVPLNKPRPPNRPNYDITRLSNKTAPPCAVADNFTTIKNGLVDTRYRWQAFNVYIDGAYDQDEQYAIEVAMSNLMQAVPCISFGIWDSWSTPTGDYVRTIKGNNNGCWSYIGKIGGGQDMHLQSPLCMDVGTIIHEMVHALGFHHEQCRLDRDDWVDIHWENIQPDHSYNFDKLDTAAWDIFGTPYNTRSIMHYHQYEFSANGQPTITAKDGGQVGSEGILQNTDIQRLKTMYNC